MTTTTKLGLELETKSKNTKLGKITETENQQLRVLIPLGSYSGSQDKMWGQVLFSGDSV